MHFIKLLLTALLLATPALSLSGCFSDLTDEEVEEINEEVQTDGVAGIDDSGDPNDPSD